NPILDGWYADPDAVKFGDTYWIYPTKSAGGSGVAHFDAFSSKDLVTWTKHPKVFTVDESSWTNRALWAPSVVKKGDKFHLYFSANAPPGNGTEKYGIGVAVADSPAGPFVDPINKPIIGSFINGADPIDQQIFHDDDGKDYMVWGNSKAMIAPFDLDTYKLDHANIKDITPKPDYFEGPYMLEHEGIYYFMWSLGAWNGPDYRVAYASSDSLFGPFQSKGVILKQDGVVADGPGHNAVLKDSNGQFWIVYHRRIIGDSVNGHRVLAIDKL
ncbi:Arabinanase/levansucrase/invertase, partial [Thozetella sp. PMI_491]